MTNLLSLLDEIEGREAAATEGPWFLHDFTEPSINANPRPCDVTVSCDHPATITVANMGNGLTATLEEARANAGFIAHARTDIPLLCARLRAALRVIREQEYAVELAATARSNFTPGSEDDMEFRNRRDSFVADARAALAAFRTACAEMEE